MIIKSLRRKFILTAMCSVVLVLTIIIGVINCINYKKINDGAEQILEMLVENDGFFPSFGDHGAFPSRPGGFSPETPFETRFFTVTLTEDGKPLFSNTSQIAAIGNNEAEEYAKTIFEKGKKEGFIGNYKYTSKEIGGNFLYVFVDCGRDLSTFRTFLLMSILISFFGIVCVFFLLIIFSKLVFKPIEESYSKQKSFITNASHDIKTPLTIISADTDVIEMEKGECEWTRDIKNQVLRLTALTEKLVMLSRMEEPNAKIRALDFSLSDAVSETLEEFSALSQANEKPLICDIPKGIETRADEAMIRQLVSLLLDNAIKYGTRGKSIQFKLSEKGRYNEITVKNEADGLTPGNHNELFERFTRTDKSRNSNTGGHGIGLSVVKAIALAHKGKISAYSDGKAISFTVLIPKRCD